MNFEDIYWTRKRQCVPQKIAIWCQTWQFCLLSAVLPWGQVLPNCLKTCPPTEQKSKPQKRFNLKVCLRKSIRSWAVHRVEACWCKQAEINPKEWLARMHWSRMEPAWTNIWKVAGYPYLKTVLSWTHLYIAYIWADIWHILHVYGLTVTSPLISIIWCFRPTLWYLMTFWVSHSCTTSSWWMRWSDYLIESREMLNGENQCREIGEGPDCDSSERLDICKPSPSTNSWLLKLKTSNWTSEGKKFRFGCVRNFSLHQQLVAKYFTMC